jgi:hypothetical protein
VVLPWSTWAMMAMLRMVLGTVVRSLFLGLQFRFGWRGTPLPLRRREARRNYVWNE